MADEHYPEMRSFVIANIRKTRLRDRTPDQQLAVGFADARDRDVAELVAALEWYGEQARLARLIHSEGDAGRQALASDGGKRARETIAKHKGGP